MMEKQLWLLRHAKADTGDNRMQDIDRPLSHRGRKQATRLGEWMHEKNLMPALIVSSPAVRARQTTELVCQSLGVDLNHVHFDPGLYLASRHNLLEIIDRLSLPEGSVMLVGHNPGLEDLLTWLCDAPLPRTTDGKLLTTTNLVRIGLSDTLSESSGRLIELTRPDELM